MTARGTKLFAVLVGVAAISPTFAHTGSVGGLLGGLGHPVLGPDHVVAMMAIGIWGACLGSPAIFVLPVVFPLVMALGGVLGILGVPLPGAEIGVAVSAIVLGAMVAIEVRAPLWIAAILVGVFAVFHGHAHGVELPPGAGAVAYAVGFVIATGALHLAGIALGLLAFWPAGRTVVRAVGVVIAVAGLAFLERRYRALLAVLVLLMATPAFAHPPPLGFTGFSGGLLHPLFVSAHVLAITGLGILIGQRRPGWGKAAPAGFVAALIVGLAAIALAFVPRYAGEAVLVGAIIAGGLTAWARQWPEPVGCALAAGIGLSVALDSPPDAISVREANLMLLGTALSAVILLLVVIACASRLARPWQRLGARIIGSWIAASAILVLALQFAR